MSIDYAPATPGLKSYRLTSGLHRFRSLLDRYARPVTPGKPLGLHLPDRVWQRQSALLMCLRDMQYDKRS
ncbi:MAG: hypothetical protein JAZ02_06010 [Candidatus Thiodiazotropha endolucinida]|nr:hypothetical protein [Candidatus Thiodiazotropha endolucinida]